jgi:hypothetical protein
VGRHVPENLLWLYLLQYIFEQRLHGSADGQTPGVARNRKEACETGCASLRRQLQELVEEENAKQKAAARAETETIGRALF